MKKNFTNIILLGYFLVLPVLSYSQKEKLSKNAADRKIMKGDEFFEGADYSEALKYYLEAYDMFSNETQLNYRVGVCYLNTINKIKSIPYFEKVLSTKPGDFPDIRFLLGQAYQLNHEFDKAITHFHEYSQFLGNYDFRNMATRKHKEECEFAKKLIAKPRNFNIYNIGPVLNTVYPEYRPVISADEAVMVFTTRRSGTIGSEFIKNEDFFEDIFISYKVNGAWSAPQNLGTPINTKGHEACLAITADGQKIFIYKDDNGDGNMYECTLKGDKWGKPMKMPSPINTEHFEGDAAISADENKFFFVSDRPGGFGQKDIYVCDKEPGGKWGNPVNLGNIINTEFDEVGPFFHPDGKTMFFSSNGLQTMGGFDIFKTKYENNKWSIPKNMGYPLNTADDDLYFVLSASGERGYYASVKQGGSGEKDIYVVMRGKKDGTGKEEPTSEYSSPLTLMVGIITDAENRHPLEAKVQVVDNEKGEVIANFVSNSKTGKYLVSLPSGKNYGISVSRDGYLFHSENFNIPLTKGYTEVTKDISLRKVESGSSTILRNVFFDTDKAVLRNESKLELERLVQLMKSNPTMRVEISGHTDITGRADYNQQLSEARARSVVDYLIGKGVNYKRMEYRGYGSTKPIAPNDTDEGKQLNRRTECKIL